MNEVHFTVDDVERILGLGHETVLRLCRPQKHPPGPATFPRAYIPFRSRRHGYRIPANDVLNYAAQEGEWLVDRVKRAIAEREASEPERILQAV